MFESSIKSHDIKVPDVPPNAPILKKRTSLASLVCALKDTLVHRHGTNIFQLTLYQASENLAKGIVRNSSSQISLIIKSFVTVLAFYQLPY